MSGPDRFKCMSVMVGCCFILKFCCVFNPMSFKVFFPVQVHLLANMFQLFQIVYPPLIYLSRVPFLQCHIVFLVFFLKILVITEYHEMKKDSIRKRGQSDTINLEKKQRASVYWLSCEEFCNFPFQYFSVIHSFTISVFFNLFFRPVY